MNAPAVRPLNPGIRLLRTLRPCYLRVMRALIFWFAAISLAAAVAARADIVNLSNGDRYIGSVELVNAAEVHLKSETLGLLKVPRAKVTSIYFGTNQPLASLEKQ